MKFRKTFERIRITSNPGSRMVKDYHIVKNEDGDSVLEVFGEFSLYDQIQSYKDSCDLNKIIEKFMVTGDPSVLNQRETFYADVTDYPKSRADMLQKYNKATKFFYSLDPDDRAKFNNDPDQFYSSIGSEKFNEIFNKSVSDDMDVKKESEDKVDE